MHISSLAKFLSNEDRFRARDHNRNRTSFSYSHSGFTLIEIMVVVIVIAILAAIIIPNFVGKADEARVSKARSDISNLMTMLEAFRLDMRRYPTQEEGFQVLRNKPNGEDANLWKGPYAKKDIGNDPWGAPYEYHNPAPNGVDECAVVSLGKDKAPGGEGDAKDINSWENYDDEKK